MLEVIDRVKKLACSGGRGACLHAGTGGCVNSGVFQTCDFQCSSFRNNGMKGKKS